MYAKRQDTRMVELMMVCTTAANENLFGPGSGSGSGRRPASCESKCMEASWEFGGRHNPAFYLPCLTLETSGSPQPAARSPGRIQLTGEIVFVQSTFGKVPRYQR